MRYCFQLQVRPERIAENVERHQAEWPEMRAASRAAGWRNDPLFLPPTSCWSATSKPPALPPPKPRQSGPRSMPLARRIVEFFTGIDHDGPPDESSVLLTDVSHLAEEK